ncbi:hypothetical protein PMAYCL1PPCAC_11492, partial [Pristionchus mayeri]
MTKYQTLLPFKRFCYERRPCSNNYIIINNTEYKYQHRKCKYFLHDKEILKRTQFHSIIFRFSMCFLFLTSMSTTSSNVPRILSSITSLLADFSASVSLESLFILVIIEMKLLAKNSAHCGNTRSEMRKSW